MGKSKKKKQAGSSIEQMQESPRVEVYTVELEKSSAGTPSFKPVASPDISKGRSDGKECFGEENKSKDSGRKRRRSYRTRAQSSSDEDSDKYSQKQVKESPSKKTKSEKKDTEGTGRKTSSRQRRKSSESGSDSSNGVRSKDRPEKPEESLQDKMQRRRARRFVSGEWKVSETESKMSATPRKEKVSEKEEKVQSRGKKSDHRKKDRKEKKQEKSLQDLQGQDKVRSKREGSPKVCGERLKKNSTETVSKREASKESSFGKVGKSQDQSGKIMYGKPLKLADLRQPAFVLPRRSASPTAESRPKQEAKYNAKPHSSLKDYMFPASSDHVVAVIPSRTHLILAGKASVRCLHGTLNITGYKLTPSRDFFPIYSPDSTTRTAVLAEDHGGKLDDLKEGLEDLFRTLGANESHTKDAIMAATKLGDSVLILRKLKDSRCDFVVSAGSYRSLFSSYVGMRGSEFEEAHEVGCGLAISRSNMVCMSHEQQGFIKRFCDDVAEGKGPVVAFCGGKNVGKSTMARHTINAVLNCCPLVAYLECDVGQTEMTPPGCVSIHMISEPLLGPPFTHQTEALSMCYMGAASSAVNPAYYMRCVLRVYQRYADMATKPPLIVNTMGWPKGLGLAFLVDTLRAVKPTYVVQLNGQSRAQNMPPVGSEFVATAPGLDCMNEYLKHQPHAPDRIPHDLHQMQSPVGSPNTDGRYRPVDLRHMALLSHLHKILTPDNPDLRLLATPPLILDWSSVAIHSMHEDVPRSQIMYALNGSLVGLCHAEPNELLSCEDSSLPKFCIKTPVCQCLGLGIVRGIDSKNRKLLLLSTLPQSYMDTINLLLLGSIELPQPLLMNQPEVNGCVPYVGETKGVLGATSIKPRRHVKRHPIRMDNGKDS